MKKIIKLDDLKQALLRLKESLIRVNDDLTRDGAIKRFEFTFELM